MATLPGVLLYYLVRQKVKCSLWLGSFSAAWRSRHLYVLLVGCLCSVAKSCLTLQPHRLHPTRFCPWDFPGKNSGVSFHSLLHLLVGVLFYWHTRHLRFPLTGVLLCCSVCQVLKCLPWPGSFSVVWRVMCLRDPFPFGGPSLLLGTLST